MAVAGACRSDKGSQDHLAYTVYTVVDLPSSAAMISVITMPRSHGEAKALPSSGALLFFTLFCYLGILVCRRPPVFFSSFPPF